MSKKNIFADQQKFVKKPNRNTFDLSFQQNGSFNFGTLYPVLCKEVLPGDSFRIQDTFGLKFAPLVFPVQTRMRASINYFYVRTRNLWSGWQDFIGKTDNSRVSPYIQSAPDADIWKTGELADWLGVPTSSYNLDYVKIPFNQGFVNGSSIESDDFWSGNSSTGTVTLNYGNNAQRPFNYQFVKISNRLTSKKFTLVGTQTTSMPTIFTGNLYRTGSTPEISNTSTNSLSTSLTLLQSGVTFSYGPGSITFEISDTAFNAINQRVDSEKFCYVALGVPSTSLSPNYTFILGTSLSLPSGTALGYSEISKQHALNPFSSDKTNGLKVSALPFRAYESIYNAFYRNQQNDPFKIRGKVEYNKFIPSDADGADTNGYTLHRHNWEMDQFTSALTSPQQGVAPLVGVTASGDFTFAATDPQSPSDSINFRVKTKLDDQGNIVAVQGYESNGADAEFIDNSIKRLNQAIMTGISINDFRNVNAMQRWLEINMRRGLRYKDQIMSHFGVDAKYEELDMPEYLGGHVEEIMVNTISQTTEGDGNNSALGSFAGQANAFGTGRNISSYFDEHGYVIAIMHIVPVPNYSQTLNKYLTKFNALDYYFPEFGHIGYQPIANSELTPLQAYQEDPTILNDVFGYQRAWYDYVASMDEVHGQLRTSLADFVISRKFRSTPKLGHDFLVVDKDTVNAPFAVVDSNDDKIFGQIYFDIQAKRPIPRFGIPRLE